MSGANYDFVAPRMMVQVAKLPNYAGPSSPLVPAHVGDAGVDLYAAEDVVLDPGARVVIPTGIAIALPEGMEAQIRPRSGNAAKLGFTVLNTPGTIDGGYRGELQVIGHNANSMMTQQIFDVLVDMIEEIRTSQAAEEEFDRTYSANTIVFKKGDRIAQLVFARFERPVIKDVQLIDLGATSRGENGLGSTGLSSS